MIHVLNIYHCERKITNESWGKANALFVCRMYYVNAGNAVIQLEGKTYALTAGNLYFMPQSSKFNLMEANDFDFTCFDFSCTPLLQRNSFIELPGTFCGLNHFFEFVNQAQHYVGYRNCAHVYSGGLSREAERNLLKTILTILEDNTELPFIRNVTINRALEIIINNLFKVTVKSLAQELHVTEGYFIHLFTRTIGISPMKYIRRLRLAEAEDVLQKGMSVAEAAEKCGYSNPNALWKAIRREYGCTPTELKLK